METSNTKQNCSAGTFHSPFFETGNGKKGSGLKGAHHESFSRLHRTWKLKNNKILMVSYSEDN
jgi:hypothetical protein